MHRGIPFPFTHDLARLITTLQQAGVPWPVELNPAVDLTVFAAGARYPGPRSPVTIDELRAAVAVARRSVAWAQEAKIHRHVQRREFDELEVPDEAARLGAGSSVRAG